MTFKEFKKTAAKLFIWTAALFIGLLAIMTRFNTPDIAQLQEQQLGLCIGVFVGLMTSVFFHVLPAQKERKRVITIEKN